MSSFHGDTTSLIATFRLVYLPPPPSKICRFLALFSLECLFSKRSVPPSLRYSLICVVFMPPPNPFTHPLCARVLCLQISTTSEIVFMLALGIVLAFLSLLAMFRYLRFPLQSRRSPIARRICIYYLLIPCSALLSLSVFFHSYSEGSTLQALCGESCADRPGSRIPILVRSLLSFENQSNSDKRT